jgi:activator of HSP90 ATPase
MAALKFRVIRQKVLLDASPGEVFDAYVDPAKHSAFTGSPASGAAKVGGIFTAWDGYISGKYLAMDRGKKIVHEWKTTEWPQGYPASLVELSFTGRGRRTELVMVHSKVPAEQAEDYAQGWKESYWEPMKEYFAGRRRAARAPLPD